MNHQQVINDLHLNEIFSHWTISLLNLDKSSIFEGMVYI